MNYYTNHIEYGFCQERTKKYGTNVDSTKKESKTPTSAKKTSVASVHQGEF